MSVKSVHHPYTGKTVYFGRRKPVVHWPRLSIKNYILKGLPTPPRKRHYEGMALQELANVDMNDTLGCCVIAAIAHLGGVFTGNAGGPALALTNDQIVSLYSAIGGYVPGNPSTDNGADIQTGLAYWMNSGLLPGTTTPHKIAGWMAVDPSEPEELMTCIDLFENLDFGLNLPDAWITPFPSSNYFTWDVAGAPNPSNGHSVAGVGYGPAGVMIDSWGLLGTMTWAAIAEYCSAGNQGELYVVISQDIINKAIQKTPIGFDFTQLSADFQALGGTLKV